MYVRRGPTFRFKKYDLPAEGAPRLKRVTQEPFPAKPELPDIPIGEATSYSCDAVIACCARDADFLAAAITSLATQRFVTMTIHVVCDGFKPSQILRRGSSHWPNLYWYWHQDTLGPYLSAMRVVRYMQSNYLIIQDADDVSLPYRVWRSCQILEQHKAVLVGGACVQSLPPGQHVPAVELAAKNETYRFSGQVWDTAPLGMCLHPASTFSLPFFRKINGYGDYLSAGDCEINTRIRVSGGLAVSDPTLYTIRQLRSNSLSHGFERHRATGYEEWLHRELASRYSEFAYEKTAGTFNPAAYGVLERESVSKDTVRLL